MDTIPIIIIGIMVETTSDSTTVLIMLGQVIMEIKPVMVHIMDHDMVDLPFLLQEESSEIPELLYLTETSLQPMQELRKKLLPVIELQV